MLQNKVEYSRADKTCGEFEDDIEGSGDIYGPVKGLSAIGMPDYDKSRQIMQEVEKKQNFENLKSMTYILNY